VIRARRRRPLAGLIALVCLIAVAATGCSPVRGIEAALLLGDISAGGDGGLYGRLTGDPIRETVRYRVGGRARDGDLYRPAAPGGAALVLVPGVERAGKDNPRLIAFARSLARAGFEVLVPDIARLRELTVNSRDVRTIADAVLHLAGQSAGAGGRPVGLVALSYAAGPALLAALSDDAGPRLRFLLTIGGYYDMPAVVTYVTTGHYRIADTEPWRRRIPNPYGRLVLLLSDASLIEDAADRDRLRAIARRREADRAADISDLFAALGPEGRAVHALLVNRDPEQVARLIAAAPAPVRREIAALDPRRRDLSRLKARLILIHGRDDSIIPFTESEKLAAAVPPGRAELFIIDRLMHVELGPMGPGDIFVLWRAIMELLAERDALENEAALRRAPSE